MSLSVLILIKRTSIAITNNVVAIGSPCLAPRPSRISLNKLPTWLTLDLKSFRRMSIHLLRRLPKPAILSRNWNLIKICVWPCDMNSTLGFVVPLAMFASAFDGDWEHPWTIRFLLSRSIEILDFLFEIDRDFWPFFKGFLLDPFHIKWVVNEKLFCWLVLGQYMTILAGTWSV